jgi:hypothetical protein
MMKVLAGDWPTDTNVTFQKSFTGRIKTIMIQKSTWSFDKIPFEDIASAEVITDENRMSVGRKLGWGVGGALLLGPIGAVIGAVAAGNMKEQAVAVVFKDGRKVMLKGKRKELEPIIAAGYQWGEKTDPA